jgi:uncharacterized repeat protein (TIGR01451 family)
LGGSTRTFSLFKAKTQSVSHAERRGISRFTSRLFRLATLSIIASIVMVAAAPAAEYATGGTSPYRNSVLWLTWPWNNGPVALGEGQTSTANIAVADGQNLAYTCSLSDIQKSGSQSLESYRPGGYGFDSLDNLYNIGGTDNLNRLTNGIAYRAGSAALTVTCSATLNGDPYNIPGFVIADAETMGPGEGATATAAGTWTVVEVRKNLGANVGPYYVYKSLDGQTMEFRGGNDNNTAAVAFLSFPTPSSTRTMRFSLTTTGGNTSVAIGILAPNADFSDAPASYGAAMHIVPNFQILGDGIPLGVQFDINTAPYTPGGLQSPTTDYIGTKGPDSEQSAQFSINADGDDNFPANNPTEENGWPSTYTISVREAGGTISQAVACNGTGYLAGWIDFDRNGTFDPGERAQAQCAGGSATLVFAVPSTLVVGKSYVRLRYATSETDIALPSGIAANGEVEDHDITIVGPSLSITKSSNAVSGGWPVNRTGAQYFLTVRNNGSEPTGNPPSVPAAPITVLDQLPPGIVPAWSGTLTSNGWSCTFAGQLVTCVTSQVLAAAGPPSSSSRIELPVSIPESFSGTSSINYSSVGGGYDPFNGGQPPAPGASCTDAAHCASHTIRIDWNPALTVEKTATWIDSDEDGFLAEGDEIAYAFRITNTGNVTLTDVGLTDELAGLEVLSSGPISSLAPGESNTTYTGRYFVTQDDVEAGVLRNSATATGTPPPGSSIPLVESPPDVVYLPPDQMAELRLVKTAVLNDENNNGRADVDETISYSFTITNTGNVTLTDIELVDPLLGSPMPGTIASLEPGAVDSTTFSGTYTLLQSDLDAGRVLNTATASAQPPLNQPRIPSNPSSTETLLTPAPGLTVVKSTDWPDDQPIEVGNEITYTFTVTNSGNVTLNDIEISDVLVGIDLDGGPLASLAPGASDSTTFTATYTVTQPDVNLGAVTNVARATGSPPTGSPITSPPSSVTVPADQTPAVELEKRVIGIEDSNGNGLSDAGDVLIYGFTVRNTGMVTLRDVTVTDQRPEAQVSGMIATLEPGASDSTSVTARYLLTQEDFDLGSVTNAAFATGYPPGNRPPVESPEVTITHPLPVNGALSIVKSGEFDDGNSNIYPDPGETLTYTFDVTNTGNITLSDVRPIDPGPTFSGIAGENALSAFTPAVVSLAPGATQRFTATYVLSAGDINRSASRIDAVANSAVAHALTPEGDTLFSNEDGALITLPGGIALTKTALLRQIRRGEEVPFRIEMTNNGTADFDGLIVLDSLPAGFGFVAGSATLNGTPVTPTVAGREISFPGVPLPPGETHVIELRLVALASAQPGTHVNIAVTVDSDGVPVTPPVEAPFDLMAEAVFDCTDIIGKVFNDRNGNGHQDEGEAGIAAARLVTVRGLVITADQHGRYSIPCAAISAADIGSNFILKLDERSLPTGFETTTPNPEVVRLTRGKFAEVNFGVSIGREVRLDLDASAFEGRSLEAVAGLRDALPTLISALRTERSYLLITYVQTGRDALGADRVAAIEETVRKLWREAREPYRLRIETSVEWQQ